MALLQALISFIGKSAGKILNAIFGWAVIALFGRTSPKQQLLLSGLVGAAAAWPLLALGIAFPKITTFLVAFVPLSHRVPSWIVRLVWLGLALLVPILVGIVVAAKAPPASPREPFTVRALRGFPVTLGIASAFLLMFVTVPVLRVVSVLKGRRDEHVPCITDGEGYDVVADQIESILSRHGLDSNRSEPSWWLAGPAKVLTKLGGKALRGFAPDHLAYWEGPDLEIAFYPSDILIRGGQGRVAWTHGLLAEAISRGPGLQTFDPETQDLERQIQRVWRVYDENPRAHVNAANLLSRSADIAEDLGKLNVDYNAWQIVYRQTAQLERALRGDPQILQSLATPTEAKMQPPDQEPKNVDPTFAAASTAELLGQLATQTAALVEKQVALAKAEVKTDLENEIKAAKGLGLAGICALAALNMLLVSVVFALSEAVGGWTAALIVAGAMLLIGGIAGAMGWGKRVKKPLEKTRRTLKEDARWAKERTT